jgi:2-methylcitrate dehydratase
MNVCAPSSLLPDALLSEIASFVSTSPVPDEAALLSASHCVLDTLSNAMLALRHGECARWLGNAMPGASLPLGCRLPGTDIETVPATAAWGLAFCQRRLGLECLWPCEQSVSPADPLAPLLCAADWLGRNFAHPGQLKLHGYPMPLRDTPPLMRELLSALLGAQELYGALVEANPIAQRGYDPSFFGRIASCVHAVRLLGGGAELLPSAVSLCFEAGLRPEAPASRGAWIAAEEARDSLILAQRCLAGDSGSPRVLSTPRSGFQDAFLGGSSLRLSRGAGYSVGLQAVYNLVYPERLSSQALAEAVLRLHDLLVGRLAEVEVVDLYTHEPVEAGSGEALLRPMAIALAHGRLGSELLSQAPDPGAEALLPRLRLHHEPVFAADRRNPDKRALPGAAQASLRDGSRTERFLVEYPTGHYRRRTEGLPLLFDKAEAAIGGRFDAERAEEILDLFDRPAELWDMPVTRFMDLWTA